MRCSCKAAALLVLCVSIVVGVLVLPPFAAHTRDDSTAQGTTILRFLGSTEPKDEAHRCADHYAGDMLPGALHVALTSFAWVRTFLLAKTKETVPGCYEALVARTNYFDQQALAYLTNIEAGGGGNNNNNNNITQFVILGAGFDTRAYRFAALLQTQGIATFEVDLPAVQALKRARVARNLPRNETAHVRFVATDFGGDDLRRSLTQHGFDESRRTLFLWEGVTPYLDAASVSRTLNVLRSKLGGASGVLLFDFAPLVDMHDDDALNACYGARELLTHIRSVGEPATFALPVADLDFFLERHGFELVDHQAPRSLARWITNARGETLGRIACHQHVVVATFQ
jgi:methyltransferase (TIGR00027 family)